MLCGVRTTSPPAGVSGPAAAGLLVAGVQEQAVRRGVGLAGQGERLLVGAGVDQHEQRRAAGARRAARGGRRPGACPARAGRGRTTPRRSSRCRRRRTRRRPRGRARMPSSCDRPALEELVLPQDGVVAAQRQQRLAPGEQVAGLRAERPVHGVGRVPGRAVRRGRRGPRSRRCCCRPGCDRSRRRRSASARRSTASASRAGCASSGGAATATSGRSVGPSTPQFQLRLWSWPSRLSSPLLSLCLCS